MEEDGYETLSGKTMCTYDFYEGQGRLDGAFCEYSEQDKLDFLKRIKDAGVINMEMESLAFAALCTHAGIRGKGTSEAERLLGFLMFQVIFNINIMTLYPYGKKRDLVLSFFCRCCNLCHFVESNEWRSNQPI